MICFACASDDVACMWAVPPQCGGVERVYRVGGERERVLSLEGKKKSNPLLSLLSLCA